MKTILITGVSGFLGSHLAQKALKNKYYVIGTDYETTHPVQKLNLSFLSSQHFTLIKSSITDAYSMNKLISKYKPQYLIHCAALTNVRKSISHSYEYIRTNTYGTTVLLEALRHNSPKTRSIFLSSSSVYGKQNTFPLHEAMIPSPQSPYALSKKIMEEISNHYHTYYNIPIILVRPFSVYGPRARLDMAPMLLIKSAELHTTFEQFGNNKTNRRDWTYVDDFTHILFSLKKDFIKYNGKIVNIGSSMPVGIESFVLTMKNLIYKYLKKDILLIKRQINPIEMNITHADIHHACKAVPSFKPTSLQIGLEKMLQFYLKNRSYYLQLWSQENT